MHKKPIILLPLIFVTLLLSLVSCGEDRWAEYKPLTAMDEWMDSVMRADYLYVSAMPAAKTLNYFSTPKSFLESTKYSEDNISHVDSTYSSSDSYGIVATFETSSTDDTLYNAVVTYVYTDSPAYRAGLRRGDWIVKVGGNNISASNKSAVLAKGAATTLSLGTLTTTTVDETTTYTVTENGTLLNMTASTDISDNPVHYYTTITSGTKKIGYLVYSNFTAGTSDAHNNDLRKAFASFSADGVTDFVLDLRYNASGDDLSSAQLLATMLVPSLALGNTFLSLKHADTTKDKTLTLDQTLIGNGANLNLSKIYILTTSATAKLSEALIASLAPYLTVYTLGSTTKGYIGITTCFTNPAFNYKFYLATAIAVNASNQTYTSAGIDVTKSISDTSLPTLLNFGNQKETMLAAAISLITAN